MTIRFRTGFLLSMVVSIALAVTLTTGTSILLARSALYEQKQDVLLEGFRADTDEIRDAMEATEHPDAVVSNRVSGLAGEGSVFSSDQGWILEEVPADSVPEPWLAADGERTGQIHYLRRAEGGELALLMSVTMVIPQADADGQRSVTIVLERSMAAEQASVRTLVARSSGAGALTLVALSLIALLLAHSVSRPLGRLTDMARQIGRGDTPRPVRTAYADVREVSDALASSDERLHETMAVLRRREERAKDFVGDVAHELRTPLASIEALAEILEDLETATAQERDLAGKVVLRSHRRILRLTEELLEISRIDAGVATTSTASVDLTSWMRSVVALADPYGEISVEGPAGQALHTDVRRATTVLSNLVRNAQVHGDAPITVSATAEGSYVQVAVRDHGPGIPISDRERAFERFTKLDPSRGENEGTGLGLAIARENARLLGGDITFKESSHGTTIVFTLPCPSDSS